MNAAPRPGSLHELHFSRDSSRYPLRGIERWLRVRCTIVRARIMRKRLIPAGDLWLLGRTELLYGEGNRSQVDHRNGFE